MQLTHFNKQKRARMVDISDKKDTNREAVAFAKITLNKATMQSLLNGEITKGDVLQVAQIAGIQAAKKTSDIIPMCHNINLTGIDIKFYTGIDFIEIRSRVKTSGKTGVEMEALTAASVAALTIYDMLKAIDKEIEITQTRLLQKTGGKSGEWYSKARVLSVNISEEKGVVKKPMKQGLFIAEHGLENDAHSGPWHRQVSLLAKESFDKMEDIGVKNLHYGDFAENITTEGIELYTLPIGTKLRIGETIHEVTQIGKECHAGCAISVQVGKCIMPKEGIFTKVLEGGIIRPSDEIEILG